MSQPAAIPVQRLLDEAQLASLSLEVAAGERGLAERRIASPRIQKPGLALAGYLPYVRPDRIQILGESEYAYLGTFSEEEAVSRFRKIVELEVPCVLSTKNNRPPQAVLDAGDSAGIPFLVSPVQTSEVIETISTFLEDELAPRTQVHGVLLDVHHRGLLGSLHELLQNYLELRGVGIIDVRKHFGMTSISPAVTISLVIQLTKLTPKAKEMEQRWREEMMERPSAWMTTENILGIEVPKYTMVVAPGRDVAIMVETAVRKCLLAQRGIEDERGFLENVNLIARGDLDEGD
ncbi:MAG: hypothetical protein P8Y93_02775 [Acidobacteriota bacterium]